MVFRQFSLLHKKCLDFTYELVIVFFLYSENKKTIKLNKNKCNILIFLNK